MYHEVFFTHVLFKLDCWLGDRWLSNKFVIFHSYNVIWVATCQMNYYKKYIHVITWVTILSNQQLLDLLFNLFKSLIFVISFRLHLIKIIIVNFSCKSPISKHSRLTNLSLVYIILCCQAEWFHHNPKRQHSHHSIIWME